MESKNSCKVLVLNAEDTTRMVCHHIDRVSEVYAIGDCPRFDLNRKTFAKESQAEGMIAMAVLSQQLADVNQGWEPDWKKDGCKWCIHS
jgi:hypothetical protein